MKDREIRTPADLAGLKIRVAGSTMADVVSALGATPGADADRRNLQRPPDRPDRRRHHRRLDAVATSSSTKWRTPTRSARNIGRGSFYLSMNQAAYDGLRPMTRRPRSTPWPARRCRKAPRTRWNATAHCRARSRARLTGDNTVIDLTPEEAQAFADAVAPMTETIVASVGGAERLASDAAASKPGPARQRSAPTRTG